jgi:hypothetical protein
MERLCGSQRPKDSPWSGDKRALGGISYIGAVIAVRIRS